MPKSHNLSQETLNHLASELSIRLSEHALKALGSGGSVDLAETLEVWSLGRGAIARTGAPLSQLAHRTGYWHHQIRHNGISKDYARSAPHGPGEADWQIHAVMTSYLPSKIEASIETIDADSTLDQSWARLLVVPTFLTISIWLQMADGSDQIFIVDAPARYTYVNDGKRFSGADFLLALGRERPVRGIPPWPRPKVNGGTQLPFDGR